jgi:hypothetical protein
VLASIAVARVRHINRMSEASKRAELGSGRGSTWSILISRLDHAVAAKDWPLVLDLSHTASGDAYELMTTGAAAPALLTLGEQAKIEQIRQQLTSVHGKLIDTWISSRRPDTARIESDMRDLHAIYAQLQQTAETGTK